MSLKLPFCLFLLVLLLCTSSLQAQVYTRRIAAGSGEFNKSGAVGPTNSIAHTTLQTANTQPLLQEDEQRAKLGLPTRLGVDAIVDLDLMQAATKTSQNGRQIAQYQFDIPTALGLSIMFDTLSLANGAQLFIYSPDKTVLIGPITSQQNGRDFWSDMVTGPTLIVEVQEPLATANQSTIHVSKLIQYYRFVPKFGFNTSDACEINTACYPAYQNEADGVAMMLTNYSPYTYACTGSMLNSTQQDFRSYLLTAFHCFDFSGDGVHQTAEKNAAGNTQFRFHWESATCTPTAADNVYLTITGSTLRASYVNSDVTLLEINQQVPPSENTTYLGWDRTNANFSSPFGIHHPSADIKKISFSNSSTSFVGTQITTGGNYNVTAGSTHLQVTWIASPNTIGVTEGGSSGSALFNSSRRVIGQLHGGGSYCSAPTAPDQYGRFFTSWTGGGTSATRLSDWLNTVNSSATTTNSVKTLVSGPAAFTSTGTFSLNSGNSATTSWSISGGNGIVSPTSGTGNVAILTASTTGTGLTITFRVNAGQSYPITFSKTFNVAAAIVENQPPVAPVGGIPNQVGTVGTALTYTVPVFTDPEGGSVTYTASNLPNGLIFTPSTRQISGTPISSGSVVTSIMATDAEGLSTSVAFLYTINCPNVSISPSSPTICAGQSVNLTASGATTYLWSTGVNTAGLNATPTTTTTYSVTGTTNGCVSTATATVTVRALPNVSINPSSPTICAGQSVNLTASGATTYLWSTGVNTAGINATPTTTTTYSVTGTTSGCVSTATATVTVRALPNVSINPSSPTICAGQSVSLTASGATTYLWSTGINTAGLNATPTTTTTYSVTGTTNGCVSTATATVTVRTLPNISINPSPVSICAGQSVSLTASGATTYLWSTGVNTAGINATPTTTTTYSVTGTVNGCVGTATATVTVRTLPNVSINPSSPTICAGQSVNLTASGATTYLWSTGVNTAGINANPTTTTTYSVTGTVNGCVGTATATVTVRALPNVSINPSSPTICAGQSVNLTASGATTYLWSTGVNTAGINATPTTTTTYSVTGTTSGCVGTTTATVTVQALPNISINPSSPTICAGQSVSLTASGATTYLWSTGVNTAGINATPTTTTTYSVTGTVNGCVGTATATVTVRALPNVSINPSSPTICAGQSVSLTANGATTYLWSTGINTAGINATPTTTTTYSVTGTVNGCVGTATATVTVQALPNVSINPSSPTICAGQSVNLTASGATTYLWSTGVNTAGINVTPTTTTTYSVTGTVNGCVGTATATVTVRALPNVSINPSSPTICAGQSVNLTASGADSFVWSTGVVMADITTSPITTTVYSVTGTTDGCATMKSMTVIVQDCTPQPLSLSATVIACSPGQLSLSFTATGGNGSAFEYAGIGVTSWTSQAGPFTVSVFTDTTPLQLFVRNINGQSSTATLFLPIPDCARPLPVTVTQPPSETETPGQPLTITGASINCTSREITLTTSGGSNLPAQKRILFVTNFVPFTKPLILDLDVFAERKPVQLQVQQQGAQSPTFTFDYAAQCPPNTTPQPPSVTITAPQQACGSPTASLGLPLSLSVHLVCQGSQSLLSFFPTGGVNQANTVFEFMSPGVTGWTSNCTVSFSEADAQLLVIVRQRDVNTNEILAQNSSMITNSCAGGAGREAISTQELTVIILGNPTTENTIGIAITGAAGQPVVIKLMDVQGHVISVQSISEAAARGIYQVKGSSQPGLYLVNVSTPTKQKTVKVLRE